MTTQPTSPNSIPLNHAPPPPVPSVWLITDAIVVIGGCTVVAGLVAAELIATRGSPFAFFGAVCFGPTALLVGAMQYWAVFKKGRAAASLATMLHAMAASLFGLSVFAHIATTWAEPPLQTRESALAILCLCMILGHEILAFRLNRRWTEVLKAFSREET